MVQLMSKNRMTAGCITMVDNPFYLKETPDKKYMQQEVLFADDKHFQCSSELVRNGLSLALNDWILWNAVAN